MVDLQKTFSFAEDVLPKIVEQRERYIGELDVNEKVEYSSSPHELDARIIGQEKDNTLLIAWSDVSSPGKGVKCRVSYIGMYDPARQHLQLLFVHKKLVNITGASVNQERTLLAFTITEPFSGGHEDPNDPNQPVVYKSFLAEIHPQNRIFSLYIERHTLQRVQFLYGDYHGYGRSKKESHMLFLHHREAIGLYHIPMARIGEMGKILCSQPRTEQVADTFIWAQWDAQHQRLYYVYPHYKNEGRESEESGDSDYQLMFAACQFIEKSKHVRVLNLPLPFGDVDVSFGERYPQYWNVALTQTVSEKWLNMHVVTLGGGCLYICLQHPITKADLSALNDQPSSDLVPLEYSVYMLHHGSLFNCVLPSIIPAGEAASCRFFFSSLNHYLMILLPDRLCHLLDASADHEPCHHIILQGDAAPKFSPQSSPSCETPLLVYLNRELSSSVQTGPSIFVNNSGEAFRFAFDKTALVDLFARTHLSTTRLALLHLVLVHMRDTEIIKKMIKHLCHDPASPECIDILREYLVGSTYGQLRRQLEKEVLKRLPFTCVDTFRGHLEKDICRKRIARIAWTSCRENPVEVRQIKDDKKKESSFWNLLQNNTSKPAPRFPLSFPSLDDCDELDETEVLSQKPPQHSGPVRSLWKRLSSSKLSGSSESISSTESKDSRDFLDCCEEERSVLELKKQNAVTEAMASFLQNQLVRDTKIKTRNIAVEFNNQQAQQSDRLLRLFWTALDFKLGDGPSNMPLSTRGALREVALFQMVEKYYSAVTDLNFPFPPGFRSFFTSLGFRCLERRMFFQYVDHGVLHLTDNFISRLVEDCCCEEGNDEVVFQIISRLKHACAKRALSQWGHPVIAKFFSQRLAEELLCDIPGDSYDPVLGRSRESSLGVSYDPSVSSLDSDPSRFRPLMALMAELRAKVPQMSGQSDRLVLMGDLNIMEERALVDIQKEIDGDLGNVPF